MKNPLTILYLDDIKRGFYNNYDPNEGYEWEDFKIDFKKNTGYNFDDLKGGSFLKAKYLFKKHCSKIKQESLEDFIYFEELRREYYDVNGLLIDKKWKECVESTKKNIEETYQEKTITFFKNYYEGTTRKITGQLDESLTLLFDELQTYQTCIQVYLDKQIEKICILIIDYNPDCYSSLDALSRHGGKLYTSSKRYWPKDKYQEMEKASKKYENREIYLPNVVAEFPYAVGTENWVKYYFSKLNSHELEKYKSFRFRVNFIICSPITSFVGEKVPKYFVNGKINWDC